MHGQLSSPMWTAKSCSSRQSMGGYIAASCTVIQPHGLIPKVPGRRDVVRLRTAWDGVVQTGKDYTDLRVWCYKMAFNYEMAKRSLYRGQGATTAQCCCAPTMTVWWDEGTCSRYAQVYTAPVDTIAGGGHNLLRSPCHRGEKDRSIHQSKSVKQSVSARRLLYGKRNSAAHRGGRTDL